MRGFTKFAVKLCICCHVDEKFKKASLLGVGSRRIELTGMGTVAEEEVSSWETGPATASSPTRTHRALFISLPVTVYIFTREPRKKTSYQIF